MNPRTVALLAGLALLGPPAAPQPGWFIPIAVPDRRSWRGVRVTAIGRFGLRRKDRPGVPSHLHAGVDIRRPGDAYDDEPVFPAAAGRVISVRDDGPFAQVIAEHRLSGGTMAWTVYEHIAGISAAVGDSVDPAVPIARLMNRRELDRYGWQFDHLHFEVMRQRPRAAPPTASLPGRRFATSALECRDSAALLLQYHDPRAFLENEWHPR